MRIYEVKKDDSPFHIALSQLGDPRRANDILTLNNLKKDDNIYPGQKLKLPNVEYKRNPYKVKKDDSPWKIALEQLGNPGRIGELMALNKLKDGDEIYEDQILELPSDESQTNRTEYLSQSPIQRAFVADPLKRYIIQDRIGEGAFGEVYRIIDVNTKQCKAMKVSKERKKNQEAEKEFTNLSTIEHENILKYFDCFYDGENHICLITELCENGDLRAKINENRTEEKFFEVKQIFDWILQATNALKYLHSDEIRIAHRDIKPENMLLTKDNALKLADFGVAKVLIDTTGRTFLGTIAYMSPELEKCLLDKNLTYSFPNDIWSLGCVLYELIFLELAFPQRRSKTNIPSFGLSGRFQQILQKMLEIDPEKRIDAIGLYKLLKSTFNYLDT